MSKRKRSKDRFVMLPFGMIDSLAFKSLNPKSIALYVYIARRYNGDNNGDISFSVREGAKYLRVSPTTANNLIKELVEKGFLNITQDSSFNYKQRKARRFELTQWNLKQGVAPDNGWRFWKPKEKEQ